MDESQVYLELIDIHRVLSERYNKKITKQKFIEAHFKEIMKINQGYFVLKDAKTYIENLKKLLNY